MAIEVFNRCEKKYLLTEKQYILLTERLAEHMNPDAYNVNGQLYKICNIYYDTSDDFLIRNSIEKPVYKEKLRLRSYGNPDVDKNVFLEIKKKHKGIVNKRRTSIRLKDAYEYLDNRLGKSELLSGEGNKAQIINEQVLAEIDYFKSFYRLEPKVYISYDRQAFFAKDDNDFRVTFDTNIKTRRDNLRLELEDYGESLLLQGIYLMEVKALGAVPLWFAGLLSEFEIYPVSFSKYGTEYKKNLLKKANIEYKKGEELCLNQSLQVQQIIPLIYHQQWSELA